jgi:hypothetical protein
VAGRLVAIRRMGKASFVNLKDEYGTIQAWIGINVIGEHDYNVFKLADLGDIVGLEGTLMLTRTGELTIRVSKYTHITKCLKPLPEKFHGLTDTEDRYRKRYLDLIVNDESRRVALMRPRIVRGIQKYCDDQGFVEVETSIFNPILAVRPPSRSSPTSTRLIRISISVSPPSSTSRSAWSAALTAFMKSAGSSATKASMPNTTRNSPPSSFIRLMAISPICGPGWKALFHYIAKNVVGKDVYQVQWPRHRCFEAVCLG